MIIIRLSVLLPVLLSATVFGEPDTAEQWNFTQWWDERQENTQLYSEPVIFDEPSKPAQQYGNFDKFDHVHYPANVHARPNPIHCPDSVMVQSEPIQITGGYSPTTNIEVLNATIRQYFAQPRYWPDDMGYMRDLRESLKEKFLSYGLKTAFHVFKTEYNSNNLVREANKCFVNTLFLCFQQASYPTIKRRQTATNIIAVLPGKYRDSPNDEIYLVGAHYDTVRKSVGVDDNGSGSTAVLEIARLLTKHKCYFNKTIIFTLFDLEEEVKSSFLLVAKKISGLNSPLFFSI